MTAASVAVALSGGLDSSVAASLLKQSGCEVTGIYAHLWDSQESDRQQEHAENLCHVLNIPFHIIDLQQEFEHYVVNYFCQEYNAGHTPNPCIICNQKIKFRLLLDKALVSGVEYLATGHYARIDHRGDGYHLLQAKDISRDQSYFLYTLTQERLRRILFPLGEYTKADIQELAKQSGVPVTTKSSQDICFISPKNYRAFLAQRFLPRPGNIVDSRGKHVGNHQGIAFYTIGQRHGLGLASDRPVYVTRIETEHDRVVIGEGRQLYSRRATAKTVSWVSGNPPIEPITITAKIRYRSNPAEATLYPPDPHPHGDARLSIPLYRVCFTHPQRALTPGQAIVFYRGDEVLGGGIIEDNN
jgi:tRNA-uridine 2-sulfurtransferase